MTPTVSRTARSLAAPDLSRYLDNRRWLWRSLPFPHLVAQRVFVERVYRELEQSFREALASEENRFARNMKGYDATGMLLGPHYRGPFEVFLSRAWHDMLAEVTGINATGDVIASLHHHEPGSKSGRPHNDLNPGWFVDSPRDDGVNIADASLCSYERGSTSNGHKARATVRALAVLFYVNNPPWSPGDGGETGLYWSGCDPVDRPVAVVPPLNNSLLCFPCSPFSYHSFIHNRRHPRNSFTMWLHVPLDEVLAQWGEQTIVGW
jgi:hypothetical protein